ncbi:hypothetical protein HKD37_01G001907 [Glycine soja]
MVGTRGLGRALGRAIGKVLGRRDESDDDAPRGEGLLHQRVGSYNNRPHDTSVLSDFENHIAFRVWNGEERPELKLSSHGRKMAKFGRPIPEIEGILVASGLSLLIACSLDTGDRGPMSAFWSSLFLEEDAWSSYQGKQYLPALTSNVFYHKHRAAQSVSIWFPSPRLWSPVSHLTLDLKN